MCALSGLHTFTTWKVSKCEGFSGQYFHVFSSHTAKYGPEKTPYLDTFHVVFHVHVSTKLKNYYSFKNRYIRKLTRRKLTWITNLEKNYILVTKNEGKSLNWKLPRQKSNAEENHIALISWFVNVKSYL